jgi:POT family proton-dependent oligopeptide transporter
LNPAALASAAPIDTPAARAARADRAFLGHPAGLGWLAACEFWERFSYYGMQALLVLYMVQQLLLPGHVEHVAGIATIRAGLEGIFGPLSTQALASQIFGLYAGFVYLTPLFGGLVADRLLGRTRTVVLGASLMAIGHFLMAFEVSFLPALACLLVGVGCFKGNIAAQVGDLYGPGDHRRGSAFQIFLLAVQVAVIVSPFVCGTLGQKVAWHYGFGAAGAGTVIGLVVYLSGRRWLPAETPRASKAERAAQPPRAPMTSIEKRNLVILVALIPVLTLTLVGNQQIFNAYILWADANFDLVFGGQHMPVTWILSFDAAISFVTMVGSAAFWRWWSVRRTEPDELAKMAIGTVLAACAPLMLVAASALVASSGQKAGLVWAFAFAIINDLGFANILPIGLALYSRAAPRGLSGLMIGVYYVHLFIGNLLVGWLGGLLEKMSGAAFWGLHAALILAAAAALVGLRMTWGRSLAPAYDAPAEGAPAH